MIDKIKRKMIYWSNHRGSKESDILLSGFIQKHIQDISNHELEILENFLQESEPDINRWLMGLKPPTKYEILIQKIIEFKHSDL